MDKKNDFFTELTISSQIKISIVTKYFSAWANVMKKTKGDIAYIDLFAGPGSYADKNKTKSTPIIILNNVLKDNILKNKVKFLFNDKEKDYTNRLRVEIDSISNISELKYKIKIFNFSVGENIVTEFKKEKLIPTFLFIDPWGYKGLTLDLISSVLKNWGCDCVFFFNYNRINPGISNINPEIQKHIYAIFGEELGKKLENEVKTLSSNEREKIILKYLKEALKKINGKYTLHFKFKSESKNKTSHFLIFVSKKKLAYDIMKDIMAKESTHKYQGVATFEYNPYNDENENNLFPPKPIDDLKKELLEKYSGRTLSVEDIHEEHNIGTFYIKANYKSALLELEQENEIITNPQKRKKISGRLSMGDKVEITFKKNEIWKMF